MRVAVACEVRPGERRVAATPETVAALVGAGAAVSVESGAGLLALAPDEDYRAAGAEDPSLPGSDDPAAADMTATDRDG